MFIQEVIIDGFKSYATRTVISGWDPQFNAITVSRYVTWEHHGRSNTPICHI